MIGIVRVPFWWHVLSMGRNLNQLRQLRNGFCKKREDLWGTCFALYFVFYNLC